MLAVMVSAEAAAATITNTHHGEPVCVMMVGGGFAVRPKHAGIGIGRAEATAALVR